MTFIAYVAVAIAAFLAAFIVPWERYPRLGCLWVLILVLLLYSVVTS